MKFRIICVVLSLGILLSGCELKNKIIGEKSDNSSSESSKSISESSDSASETDSKSESDSDSEKAVECKAFSSKYYALDNEKCAVEVPEDFEQDKNISAVSGTLHFNGSEPDDMIAVDVFKGYSSEDFEKFDENKMFELINYSTTLPQLQYFKETEIKNADGIKNKAYIGETLGTIDGVDTYVTMLAVNCPDDDKMYVLSMRDKTGEYKPYRDNLGDYFYLTENGYKVENNKLEKAPEPEPLVHSNENVGYSISLPKEWGLVTNTETFYGLESIVSNYDNFDLFMNNDRDYAFIASKSMNISDQEFYSSMEQYEQMNTGAGGNELVSSKECEIGGYAAYQIVIKHTAGADPTTSTTWLVNKTGDNSQLIAVNYYYRDDKGAEFADKFINSINFQN